MNAHSRTLVSVTLLLAVAGCVHVPAEPNKLDLQLLHGAEVFGHEITPAPTEDLLALSPEMHDFLNPDISSPDIAYTRFRRLMRGLQEGGHFANNYDAGGTFSAAQTFADGKGNCLGYTNMFIALARGARLDAKYQLIEADPNWNVESGYLIKNNHVNVVVEGIRLTSTYQDEVIVDFNLVRPDPNYSTAEVISDDFASALFHANLAVDAMHAGEYEAAFAHLKRGALTAPENKMVWANLGVLLSKLGHPALAQRAYEQVLRLDARDKSAWVGMAVNLRAQGKHEEAAAYNQRVERYQLRNPYYHYALAESAYRQQDYTTALASVQKAISMRGQEARFHLLRAATAMELGDEQLAQRSKRLAAKYYDRRVRSARATAIYRYD